MMLAIKRVRSPRWSMFSIVVNDFSSSWFPSEGFASSWEAHGACLNIVLRLSQLQWTSLVCSLQNNLATSYQKLLAVTSLAIAARLIEFSWFNLLRITSCSEIESPLNKFTILYVSILLKFVTPSWHLRYRIRAPPGSGFSCGVCSYVILLTARIPCIERAAKRVMTRLYYSINVELGSVYPLIKLVGRFFHPDHNWLVLWASCAYYRR